MKAKTIHVADSPLADVVPGFQFAEEHRGLVDAPPARVWAAIRTMRWTDLRVGWPLMVLRGLSGPVAHDTVIELFTRRAGALLVEEPTQVVWLVMVGRPWSLVPRHVELATPDEVRAFREPGWLKYGMEWRLHDLGDGRTLVETRTLCEATDAGARRAFRAYWTLIRAGSGLIRRDMIAALRRLTASSGA